MAGGDEVVLLESMKMEIPVILESGGRVERVAVAPGTVVQAGDLMLSIAPGD